MYRVRVSVSCITVNQTMIAARRQMMKLATIGAILAFAALGSPATAARSSYDYFEIGDVRAPRPGPTAGALLLVGGGDWDPAAFRWFVEKAGHGHIVVLRASGAAEANDEFYRTIGGVKSVQSFVFHDRKAAFDPRVLSALKHADGIFIAGGDQSNYVRYWKGTPVARAIDAHVAAGRPLGGTSAGFAILGGAGYGAMDGGSIDSASALRDPGGSAVTIVRDFLHLPHLAHVVTDTHFNARNRLGRLIAFVARVRADGDRRAVGLGVDQDSALCVEANGVGHLHSLVKGFAWLVEPVGVARIVRGQPLNYSAVRITGIGPDSSIDLKTLRVTNPAFSGTAVVRAGRLSGVPGPASPVPASYSEP